MKKIFILFLFGFAFINVAWAQSASFSVNLGKPETGDNKALLYISAPADTAYLQISNKPDFSESAKIAFTQATLWDICSGLSSCAAGTYNIYVKLISSSGDEQVISNSINYTGISSDASSSAFSRVLRLRSVGQDVKSLQIYLNNHGFLVASAGAGSRGLETTYFGARTKAALKMFQEANASAILTPLGLSAGTGIMGVKTIEFIRNNL